MKRTAWRVTSLILMLTAATLILSTATSEAQTAYFLVADPWLYRLGLGDSYVLPLTDLDDIAMARALMAAGAFKIVFATVTAGADGINRDMLAPGMPEWSWHVVEFQQFGDLGIEICDGSPTLTEVDAQYWSEGQEEIICYWSYTVVEELTMTSSSATTWGGIKALFGE